MANEKMEQLHISVPLEMRQWVIDNKENHGCDSINSFGRYIIRDFQSRGVNGEIKKRSELSLSGLYFALSILIPLFLFVMARVNSNDVFLYVFGIISLAGPVMLFRQR